MKTLEPRQTIVNDIEAGLRYKVELETGRKTMICYVCSKPLSQGWFGAGWDGGPRGTFDTAECREEWRKRYEQAMGQQA
jgi:hypothetical protein